MQRHELMMLYLRKERECRNYGYEMNNLEHSLTRTQEERKELHAQYEVKYKELQEIAKQIQQLK